MSEWLADPYAPQYFQDTTARTRGWLGIDRWYHDRTTVAHYEIVIHGKDIVNAKVQAQACFFEAKLREDRRNPGARWSAANGDFCRWSDARWSLIDKYMEPVA